MCCFKHIGNSIHRNYSRISLNNRASRRFAVVFVKAISDSVSGVKTFFVAKRVDKPATSSGALAGRHCFDREKVQLSVRPCESGQGRVASEYSADYTICGSDLPWLPVPSNTRRPLFSLSGAASPPSA